MQYLYLHQILSIKKKYCSTSSLWTVSGVGTSIALTQLDLAVIDYDKVTVRLGLANEGKEYYWLNNRWNEGQTKTKINQYPLFELYDNDGVPLSLSLIHI